jgi:hypothetical protein
MAAPTIDELKVLSFGYLTGIDLLRYCPFQVLQKQYAVEDTSLQIGCDIAYSEALSALSARYDITTELTKEDTSRYSLMVKIVSILAVRNITGNQSGLPENMIESFKWVETTILNIRNGQESLMGLNIAPTAKLSQTQLVQSSFSTLG